jgi:hypothetical protein
MIADQPCPDVPGLTRRAIFALAGALLATKGASAQNEPGPITAEGRNLAVDLDGMNVEGLWQHGYHVDWRTGVAHGPPETSPGGHTHCSAFAAAVAERVGAYLLHPPEHPQQWLANAQERWLNSAAAAGWKKLGLLSDPGTSLYAVAQANLGKLVVAIYFQPPRITPHGPEERSGHIAIVRPSEKPPALIEREGPDVIQASTHNHRSIALREGFAAHPEGLASGAIEYFVHDTVLPG